MKKNSRSFVKAHLMPHIFLVGFGTLLSLFLGVVSALLGTLIGPSFKALMDFDSGVASPMTDLVGPWFGSFFESVFNKSQVTPDELLSFLPIILIVIAAIKSVTSLGQWYIWEYLSEKIARLLRMKIIKGFTRLDLSKRHFAEVKSVEENLSATLSNDTRMFREFIVHFYGGAPREAFQVIVGIFGLYLLSPYLFAVCFLGVLPATIVLRAVGRKIHKQSARSLDQFSDLSEYIQERLLGLETIKHYRTEQLEISGVKKKIAGLLHSYKQLAKVKSRTSPMLEMIAILAIAFLLVLAFRGIEGGKTSGSVFMSFLGSLGLLSQSFTKLGKYYNINRESYAAIDRIKEWLFVVDSFEKETVGKITSREVFLGQPGDRSDDVVKKALILSDVHFSYPGGNKVLDGISFRFEAGKIYALSGASGAGKSTCMKILLGLLPPSAGSVYFEGVNAPKVGYMPQNVALFAGSIIENLAWPFDITNTEKAKEALRQVSLWDFVSQLDAGLHHVFNLGAKDISGGQCQRLLLGRLFYQDYDVIFIDEGTSAVDPESERIIMEGIKKLAESGAIVIMIAHRKTMLSFADQVIAFGKGKILAHGSYLDLSKTELSLALKD